jgi:hypothetical protein
VIDTKFGPKYIIYFSKNILKNDIQFKILKNTNFVVKMLNQRCLIAYVYKNINEIFTRNEDQ